ncbi:MAG: glycerate kinase [Candidatus Gracilibacteria bacterium]|nr:glycerate kinase [Candidatus Gracilibacteria bacterium]
MKKVLLVPDSFKGNITQLEFIALARAAIKEISVDTEIVEIPVADGGDGTVDCFLHALDGEKIELEVTGSNFEKVSAYWGKFKDFAVMEVASACGLARTKNKNPLVTTTYGVGEILKDMLEKGEKNIIIGLGGSSTNDMGVGMAAALGVEFYDKNGELFIPTGGTLDKVSRINDIKLQSLLEGVTITAMCDVRNPLCGQMGAAKVYARQKGASDSDIITLEQNLESLISLLDKNDQVRNMPGAGAAGGLGAGVVIFLRANLKRGIEAVLDMVGFDEKVQGVDFIVTGEGKVDSTSLHGKVIDGIAKRLRAHNKLLDVFCGVNELDRESQKKMNIGFLFEVSPDNMEDTTGKLCLAFRQYFKERLLNTGFPHVFYG